MGERACCCPAPAQFRALLPSSPGRAQWTDLLLCAHHLRLCQAGLARAGAELLDASGARVTLDGQWRADDVAWLEHALQLAATPCGPAR